MTLDGVINVLKPPGMTSNDVVVYLRKMLNIKKVGHTGTLDPGAAGVLPICLGKATRLSEYIMADIKVYRCEMVLGVETDTLDADGKVIATSDNLPDIGLINKVFAEFQGNLKQTPPMYSAIKHNGKRLYELARKGQSVEVPSREVTIYKNCIRKFIAPNRILFEVECSKGTYIRSLCHDIGKRLGCGAYMFFLLRSKSGNFDLDYSYTFDEINKYYLEEKLSEIVVSCDKAVEQLRRLELRPEVYSKIINGNSVETSNVVSLPSDTKYKEQFRIYCDGDFIGIGYLRNKFDKQFVQMKKVLI